MSCRHKSVADHSTGWNTKQLRQHVADGSGLKFPQKGGNTQHRSTIYGKQGTLTNWQTRMRGMCRLLMVLRIATDYSRYHRDRIILRLSYVTFGEKNSDLSWWFVLYRFRTQTLQKLHEYIWYPISIERIGWQYERFFFHRYRFLLILHMIYWFDCGKLFPFVYFKILELKKQQKRINNFFWIYFTLKNFYLAV